MNFVFAIMFTIISDSIASRHPHLRTASTFPYQTPLLLLYLPQVTIRPDLPLLHRLHLSHHPLVPNPLYRLSANQLSHSLLGKLRHSLRDKLGHSPRDKLGHYPQIKPSHSPRGRSPRGKPGHSPRSQPELRQLRPYHKSRTHLVHRRRIN